MADSKKLSNEKSPAVIDGRTKNDPRKHMKGGSGGAAKKAARLEERVIDKLSNRQEEFCQLYVQHSMNNAECARRVGYSDKHARVVANRLLKNPNIKRRIQELELEAGERNKVSLDEVISGLRTARDSAMSSGAYGPAVRATELLGRYIGMFSEKIDHKHIGLLLATNDPTAASQQLDRFNRISKLGEASEKDE